MNIGVAGADDNAVVVVEQEVAIQSVSPGFDHEKEAEQRGAMGDCRWVKRSRLSVQTDVVVQEIN